LIAPGRDRPATVVGRAHPVQPHFLAGARH
jgi:hypothetical protein